MLKRSAFHMRRALPVALAGLALAAQAAAARRRTASQARRRMGRADGHAQSGDDRHPRCRTDYTNIFNTLVWLTQDLQPTPDLATKWSVSGDGKTYDFTLRQGVTFQDGTPFNAEAVVANFDYITTSNRVQNRAEHPRPLHLSQGRERVRRADILYHAVRAADPPARLPVPLHAVAAGDPYLRQSTRPASGWNRTIRDGKLHAKPEPCAQAQ